MKLYVQSPSGTKEYLSIKAKNRLELAQKIGGAWFFLKGVRYHVHNVVAETEISNLAVGAVIGGIIGLVGGPIGALTGGTIGGALGNENDRSEKTKAIVFNQSRVDEENRW